MSELTDNHPSLAKTKKLSTLESLETVKSEIESLKAKTASLRETAGLVEQSLSELDVFAVIADLQSTINGFVSKYDAVLSKMSANADAEAELLAAARKVVGA